MARIVAPNPAGEGDDLIIAYVVRDLNPHQRFIDDAHARLIAQAPAVLEGLKQAAAVVLALGCTCVPEGPHSRGCAGAKQAQPFYNLIAEAEGKGLKLVPQEPNNGLE